MKKRKYQNKSFAMAIALFLTTAMLTGCGDGSDADAMAFNSARNESLARESDNSGDGILSSDSEDSYSEEPSSEAEPISGTDENTPVSSGSGTATAEDYENDLTQILALSKVESINTIDSEEALAQVQAWVDGMDMKSPEGKVIKTDFQEMVDIMTEMIKGMSAMENIENFEDIDWNIILEYTTKLDELSIKLKDHTNNLANAAQAAGVDSDAYENLKSTLGL